METKLRTYDWKMDSMPSAFCHIQAHRFSAFDEFKLSGSNLSVLSAKVKLVSYETCVCWIERLTSACSDEHDEAFLYCTGNYSRSTVKHIGLFTQEFCGDNKYHTLRDLLKEALRMDYNISAVEYKLTDEELKAFDKKLVWYEQNGSKFTKYRRTPNYDNYSRNFNPLYL